MRNYFWAAVLVLSMFLAGCSGPQLGIDSLLSPPKLSTQQSEIYAALEASVERNIKLKYPRRGEDYTSAIVIHNLDDHADLEAVAFYEMQDVSAGNPLRIKVLGKNEEGRWEAKIDTTVDADEVDKVDFVTVNQKIYMIIGYVVLSSPGKKLAIYSYQEGKLDTVYQGDCVDYDIFETDENNTTGIVTFEKKKDNPDDTATYAFLREITSTGADKVSEAVMDPNVTQYLKIQSGRLVNGSRALYIDGQIGSRVVTEILTCQDGRLRNLIYYTDPKKNMIDRTLRDSGMPFMDLDKDGIIEIPTLRSIRKDEEELQPYQVTELTQWYQYNGGELSPIKTTYVNYSLGFLFTIPEKWISQVNVYFITADNDGTDNELLFSEYSPGAEGAQLLSIKVVRPEAQEENQQYTAFPGTGQLQYLYRRFYTGLELSLSDEEILDCFSTLR